MRAGQRIAEVESDKSVLDLSSPVEGTVDSILVAEGEPVGIGTALALIDARGNGRGPKEPDPRGARSAATRKAADSEPKIAARRGRRPSRKTVEVGMSRTYCATGSRRFSEFGHHSRLFPRRTAEEVLEAVRHRSPPPACRG